MPTKDAINVALRLLGIDEQLKKLQQFAKVAEEIDGKRISIQVGSPAQRAGAREWQRTLRSVSRNIDSVLRIATRGPTVLARFADQFVHLGQVAATFAYRMTLVTAPLMAFIATTGKAAADLEENMAFISTQLDMGGKALESFSTQAQQSIVNLSTEVPRSANDIAEAMYYIVSSMTVKPEVAQKMLEPIAKAAVGAKTTTEEWAEAITPILNVYKLVSENAETTLRNVEHVNDVIFAAVKRGRAEASDMITQIGDFIQFAKQAGATFEEAMAVFAEATRVTTPAQAATWVANIYRTLFTPRSVEALKNLGIAVEEPVKGTGRWIKATKELTEEQQRLYDRAVRALKGPEGITGLYRQLEKQQKRLQDLLEQYAERETTARRQAIENQRAEIEVTKERISYYEQIIEDLEKERQAVHKVWTGEMRRRSSLAIITDLARKIRQMRSDQEKLAALYEVFPRMRGIAGALVFIENLAEITEWTNRWREATGLTEEAFSMMADTVNAKLGIIRNLFQALGIDIFETYREDIKDFIDSFGELLKTLRDLDPAIKQQIYKWAMLFAALGPLSLIIGTILMGLGGLVTVIGQLLTPMGIAGLTLAWKAFHEVLGSAWETIKDYTGEKGFKGLIALVADLAVQFGLLKEREADVILEKLGISTQEIDSENFEAFVKSVKDFGEAVRETLDKIKAYFDAFVEFIDKTAARENATGRLIGHLAALAKWLTGLAGADFDITKRGIEGVADAIDKLASRLLKLWMLAKGLSVLAWVLRLGGGGAAATAAKTFLGTEGALAATGERLAGLLAKVGPAALEPHALALLIARATSPEYPDTETIRWIMEHFHVSGPEAARMAYRWSRIPPPKPGEAIWAPAIREGPVLPPYPPGPMTSIMQDWLAKLLVIPPEVAQRAAEITVETARRSTAAQRLREEAEALLAYAESMLADLPRDIKQEAREAVKELRWALVEDPRSIPWMMRRLQSILDQVRRSAEDLSSATKDAATGLGGLAGVLTAMGQAVSGDWWARFTAEHGGRTPLGAYRRHERPLQAALIDKLWSEEFARRMGRPPMEAEWRQHWYEYWMPLELWPGGPIAAPPGEDPWARKANALLNALKNKVAPGFAQTAEEIEKSWNETFWKSMFENADAFNEKLAEEVYKKVYIVTEPAPPGMAGGAAGGGTSPRQGRMAERESYYYQFGGYAVADALYRLAERGQREYVISFPVLKELERSIGALTQGKLMALAGGPTVQINNLYLPNVSDGRTFIEQLREVAYEADGLARVGYG